MIALKAPVPYRPARRQHIGNPKRGLLYFFLGWIGILGTFTENVGV